MTSEHFDTFNKNEHDPVAKEAVEEVLNLEIEKTEDLKVFTETKKSEATIESEQVIVEGDNAIDSLVKSIGASPDDVVEGKSRLAQISEKVKGNLKSFMLKVSMVGALGGLAGQSEAIATDPPTDKEKKKASTPKENVVYISDPEEYERRKEAYEDSLALYTNHQEITKNLLNEGYFNSGTLKEKADRNNNLMFGLNGLLNHKEAEEFNDFVKNTKENKDKFGFRKESKNLSSVLDFVPGQINESIGRQLFSENIQPQGMSHYEWRNKTLSGWYNDFQKARSGEPVKEGDVRMVADYSNVKPKQKVVFKETPFVKVSQKEIPIKPETVKSTEKTISQQEKQNVGHIETVPQTEIALSITKPESFPNKQSSQSVEKAMQKFPTKERISYTTFLNEKNPEFDYVKDEVLAKKGDPSPYFRVKKEEQKGEYNPHLILRAEGEMQRNAYTNPHAWEVFVRKSAKEKIDNLRKDISTDSFKEMSPERQQKAKEFIESEIEKTKLDQEWYIKNYESVTKPYRESFKKYDEEKAWLRDNISSEEYKRRLTQFEGLDASTQEERLQNIVPEYSLGGGSNYNFETKNIKLNLDSEEPNMIHEGQHQATDAESGMSEFAKNLYQNAFTKEHMTEGDQIINMGQEGYFENVTEIDARKKVLEYEMEKLGVKKYSEKFTQEHYQKLLELQKEGKLSKNSNQFLRMIKPEFLEQIMTTIAFEDVGNNSTETPTA